MGTYFFKNCLFCFFIISFSLLCNVSIFADDNDDVEGSYLVRDLIARISYQDIYDQKQVLRFLSLLETKKHSFKDIRHQKKLEQFMNEKVFTYDSNMSDFIKQAWILSEQKQMKLGTRLELFALYLVQKSYTKDGIDTSKIQSFFINHYLVQILNLIDRYVDEYVFSSGMLGTDVSFLSVFVGRGCLFESARLLREKASMELSGRYHFLDIPIEFFSDKFVDEIKGTSGEKDYILKLFDSIYRWSIKYNDSYPPVDLDFTEQSKKVGITKNRIIGNRGVFKDYTEFLTRFKDYLKGKKLSLNFTPQDSGSDTKAFILKWEPVFSRIKNQEHSQELKDKFLQAVYEWMKLFKTTPLGKPEFISSKDLTTKTFGIYSSAVLGQDKLFYSMYDLQKNLIVYVKKLKESFIVRENIPIEVPEDISDYILSLTFRWIVKHQKLPTLSKFKMDTFLDNVGVNINSFLRVFGFKGYDAILYKVYIYAIHHTKKEEILALFSEKIKNYSVMEKEDINLSVFKNKWEPLFLRIKNETPSKELKTSFMDCLLEWMRLFNDNKFLRSSMFRPKSFGLDIIYIIGESKLFYSMFELQEELINYAISKGLSFGVREGIAVNLKDDSSSARKEHSLELMYSWIKERGFLRLPSKADFGIDRFSGKIGVSYKSIGLSFSSLSYHNLMNELYLYAKAKGEDDKNLKIFDSINEQYVGEPIKRIKRGKYTKVVKVLDKTKLEEFRQRWVNDINFIKDIANDITVRKIKFMDLLLDWMEEFNNSYFVDSDQLSVQEIGINIRDVIGSGRLFYSTYLLQQELIYYSKTQGKNFKVREDVPLKIEGVDLRFYVLEKIADWIYKNNELPELDYFSQDTFLNNVGLIWNSVCTLLGTRDYDKVMSLVYQYELVYNKREKVLLALRRQGYPKAFDEYRTPREYLDIYYLLERMELNGATSDTGSWVTECKLKMSEK